MVGKGFEKQGIPRNQPPLPKKQKQGTAIQERKKERKKQELATKNQGLYVEGRYRVYRIRMAICPLVPSNGWWHNMA